MTTAKTRLTSAEQLTMGVRKAGDEYQIPISLWDGTGRGDDGADLISYVTVGPVRSRPDGAVHVSLQDDLAGEPTVVTAAEARDLALLLLVVANRAEYLAVGVMTGHGHAPNIKGRPRPSAPNEVVEPDLSAQLAYCRRRV